MSPALTPGQQFARQLVTRLLLTESQRELAARLRPPGSTLTGVTLGNIANGKRGAGREVIRILCRAYPEHTRDLLEGGTDEAPADDSPVPDPSSTTDRGGTTVEYPERYPNRVEAMRAFATVYRCTEEEVQRISKVAAVALHSETDPSVEAWFKELERARSYLKRERRGHGHLGEREVDPEDA